MHRSAAHVYTYAYVHSSLFLSLSTHIQNTYICIQSRHSCAARRRMYIYMHMYIYVHVYIYADVYMYAYVHTALCVSLSFSLLTHIYMYLQTERTTRALLGKYLYIYMHQYIHLSLTHTLSLSHTHTHTLSLSLSPSLHTHTYMQ